jgi:hypothetical protein
VDLVTGSFTGFTFGKTDTGFTTDTWVELWENQMTRPQGKSRLDALRSGQMSASNVT